MMGVLNLLVDAVLLALTWLVPTNISNEFLSTWLVLLCLTNILLVLGIKADNKVRARIFKLLRSPRIDSKESISPAYVARAHICKRLRRPGIDSEDSIPPAYAAWQAGTLSARQAGNRFLAGRYDNPLPTRFLAPIDCLKISSTEYSTFSAVHKINNI
jgi:hypothetical protein